MIFISSSLLRLVSEDSRNKLLLPRKKKWRHPLYYVLLFHYLWTDARKCEAAIGEPLGF